MSAVNVSLRGSLAVIYASMAVAESEFYGELVPKPSHAEFYIAALIRLAEDGRAIVESQAEEDGTLVLGLISEKGRYPPDW